jgi:phospholipid/cholesterol/gamma-HCH transport system permease protein
MPTAAAFAVLEKGDDTVLALEGDWTVDTIAKLDADLRALEAAPLHIADVSKLGRIDVAGAYLVSRTLVDGPLRILGDHPSAERLIEAARTASHAPVAPEPALHGLYALLERTGRAVVGIGDEVSGTLSFIGETLSVLVRLALKPQRIRWVSVVHVMEHAGLNAVPIVAMLSFFIGLVVAYLGARILGDFGASVFTVELVAFSVMREFGIVITAVLLAGRTNSAFTAEIGAMKMRQEIDAMRVLGIDPMEALTAPRVIAMLLMTPILTFVADMAGLFGGLLVAWGTLGVSPNMFFNRIADAVPSQHFWVGMIKSPIFAFVLAVVACRQGLLVGGDVGSLGKRTTASVVQAIFLIILLDAIFALWFLELDI